MLLLPNSCCPHMLPLLLLLLLLLPLLLLLLLPPLLLLLLPGLHHCVLLPPVQVSMIAPKACSRPFQATYCRSRQRFPRQL